MLSPYDKKKITKADFTKIVTYILVYVLNKNQKGMYENINSAYPLVLELQRIFTFFNLSFYT